MMHYGPHLRPLQAHISLKIEHILSPKNKAPFTNGATFLLGLLLIRVDLSPNESNIIDFMLKINKCHKIQAHMSSDNNVHNILGLLIFNGL